MPMKPEARPAQALPVTAQIHFSGPLRNNGWMAPSVPQSGGEKRRLSRASRTGPRLPTESIRLRVTEYREVTRTCHLVPNPLNLSLCQVT